MVKKKKNRHQQEPDPQNVGDSTESCDENQANASGGKCCPHIAKGIDLGKVKKALRAAGGLAQTCSDCSKGSVPPDSELSAGHGLWLCLKCGHQGCGRTCQQHALRHYLVPHSDIHALATDTKLWNVWCYACDMEVAATCRKKLHECILYLKQQECCTPVTKSNAVNCVACVEEVEEEAKEACGKPLCDLTNTAPAGSPRKKGLPLPSLPRVRGLRNLGNTCFFNAVLQCLAQTPFLLDILHEMREPGHAFHLPGIADELPPLEGELGKWGSLTETLASTLSELQTARADVFDPQRLLSKLTQRCSQFSGGDQHDSHELLRHLLEEVRNEDLKRYQGAILQKFGLNRVDPNAVQDDVRRRARAYGRQASELILHPEQVFRGQLVSTLECQDCLHSSQRVETFLELSLPVTANKPQPPVLRRKTSNDDAFDLCGNFAGDQPSKHQLKKERKQARKGRKKQKMHLFDISDGEPGTAEENVPRKNSGESEQSDADVEDNLEQDVGHKDRSRDVGESGYSSEKAANDDSAIESPICRAVNGDSALTSPALNGDSALASPDFPIDKDCVANKSESSPQSGECLPSLSTSPICNGEVDSYNSFSGPERKDLCCTIASNEVLLDTSLQIDSNHELVALGSPVSNRETPSPVSSEVNIECASPASTQVHGDCTSPVSDLDRPFSRFAFCPDDDPLEANSDMQMSPTETVFSSTYQGGGEGSVDASKDNKLVEDLAGLSLALDDKGSSLLCNHDGVSSPFEMEVPVCNGKTNGKPPPPSSSGDMLDKNVTMAPRYQCEEDECSVESCLNQFTVLELMTGNNKVVCENCTKRINQGKEGKMVCTNSTKQFLVSSPPAILILHLKRFEVHRTMFRKISRHVSFPLVLDLAPICSSKCKELPTLSPEQNQVLYALYGVVEHSGTLHGGHYVAYVKVRPQVKPDDPRWFFLPTSERQRIIEESPAATGGTAEPPPGKWYYVSDSRVSEVQEDCVLRSQAYLLFYERIW